MRALLRPRRPTTPFGAPDRNALAQFVQVFLHCKPDGDMGAPASSAASCAALTARMHCTAPSKGPVATFAASSVAAVPDRALAPAHAFSLPVRDRLRHHRRRAAAMDDEPADSWGAARQSETAPSIENMTDVPSVEDAAPLSAADVASAVAAAEGEDAHSTASSESGISEELDELRGILAEAAREGASIGAL